MSELKQYVYPMIKLHTVIVTVWVFCLVLVCHVFPCLFMFSCLPYSVFKPCVPVIQSLWVIGVVRLHVFFCSEV